MSKEFSWAKDASYFQIDTILAYLECWELYKKKATEIRDVVSNNRETIVNAKKIIVEVLESGVNSLVLYTIDKRKDVFKKGLSYTDEEDLAATKYFNKQYHKFVYILKACGIEIEE